MFTADDIARAVVTACAITQEEPTMWLPGSRLRARPIVHAALREAFPDVPKAAITRACGYKTPNAGKVSLITARNTKWWDDDIVTEVVGAVVAPQYGTRAA
jgi:hypothetical protein